MLIAEAVTIRFGSSWPLLFASLTGTCNFPTLKKLLTSIAFVQRRYFEKLPFSSKEDLRNAYPLGIQAGCEKLESMAIPMGPGNTDKQLQMMVDLKATVITATSSYALLLANEGAPLLRFRTHDISRIKPELCSCKSSYPLIDIIKVERTAAVIRGLFKSRIGITPKVTIVPVGTLPRSEKRTKSVTDYRER